MSPDHDPPPQYTRYRARRRLLAGREQEERVLAPRSHDRDRASSWRARITPKRVVLGLLALVFGWLALSLVLFLLSSHFERTSPPANVASVLDPGGFPLTSANNILVLGSDRRQKGSKEPGAHTSGPSRSDSIMLLRIGGGHSARLSIPRDTVVEIPGHGEQKINAAYAFGGPALSISVIKDYLGIPINHLVEVNFEDFPQLIDAMGGIDYTGGCIVSRLEGGFSRGGYTLGCHPAPTTSTAGRRSRWRARARTCAGPARPTCSARRTSRRCSPI